MKTSLCASLALVLAFTACNGNTNNAAPTPVPTATPCVLPSGSSSTASTFPAAAVVNTNYNLPAVANTIDVMSAGNVVAGGNTLTFAIATGTCIATAPPGTTIYQFIAMSALLGPVTFPTIPGFAFTFPASLPTAGRAYALYQYNPSVAAQWVQVLGAGAVAGQTVTFAAGGTGFTLQAIAGQGQIFALTSTP